MNKERIAKLRKRAKQNNPMQGEWVSLGKDEVHELLDALEAALARAEGAEAMLREMESKGEDDLRGCCGELGGHSTDCPESLFYRKSWTACPKCGGDPDHEFKDCLREPRP